MFPASEVAGRRWARGRTFASVLARLTDPVAAKWRSFPLDRALRNFHWVFFSWKNPNPQRPE